MYSLLTFHTDDFLWIWKYQKLDLECSRWGTPLVLVLSVVRPGGWVGVCRISEGRKAIKFLWFCCAVLFWWFFQGCTHVLSILYLLRGWNFMTVWSLSVARRASKGVNWLLLSGGNSDHFLVAVGWCGSIQLCHLILQGASNTLSW